MLALRAFTILSLAIVLGLGGCFAEMWTGAYAVKQDTTHAAFGGGIRFGVYLDPPAGKTRVAYTFMGGELTAPLGSGGVRFLRNGNTIAGPFHHGIRVDTSVFRRRTRLQKRLTAEVTFSSGHNRIYPRLDVCCPYYDGGAQTFFGGLTWDLRTDTSRAWPSSLGFSVGPAVMHYAPSGVDDVYGAGGQVRFTYAAHPGTLLADLMGLDSLANYKYVPAPPKDESNGWSPPPDEPSGGGCHIKDECSFATGRCTTSWYCP